MLHLWREMIHHWRVELLTLKESTMRKILLLGQDWSQMENNRKERILVIKKSEDKLDKKG